MFCNYCGAPHLDVASFCNKCGKALVGAPASASVQAQPTAAQPIRYVMEASGAAAAPVYSAPIATGPTGAPRAVSVSPPAQVAAAPVIGALSLAARAEFRDGLTVEVRRQMDDKCIPAGIAAWIFTLVIVARYSITWLGTQTGLIIAVVMAFVSAGIVFKVVQGVLENKYLRPIASLSDEMLVNRYNEAKADRRAARTRTAISWAVIAIIAVLLAVVWLAAHHQ